MAAVLMLSSCLSNDDEDNTTYYDDTAIASFTLGNIRILHHTTTKDGTADSTYYTTTSGSSYKFDIDQLTATISNSDSLPVGTDVKHILANAASVNSGTVVLNLRSQSGADSLAVYSSTDSIDFTNPVRFRVYNMRGTAYRDYTVKINVHQQDGDGFNWNTTTVNGLADVTGRRIYTATNGNTYLFGYRSVFFVVYQKTDNGWTEQNWSETPSDIELAATDNNAYILRDGNILRRSVNGGNWTVEQLDDNAANLPTSDANIVVKASKVNEGTYNLILIGNRDGKTVIWDKVEESDNATNPWAFYTADDYNTKTLPYLSNLHAIAYGDGILATGGDFTKVYYSPDNGLTWSADATYALPTAFGLTESAFGFGVDSNNIMYISKDGSDQIWSGRLNKLGWKKQDTVFTK